MEMILFAKFHFKSLHCFTQLFCVINIVFCDPDVVDAATVDVVYVSCAADQNTPRTNSSFAEITGKFARVGAVKKVQGELREIKLPEECKESDTYDNKSTESNEPWIGVMEIPATEYLNSYGSRSCSVLDRVRQAMLIGASALLIITVNYKVTKKLDLVQLFTRPVVFVSGTNASRVLDSLKSNKGKRLSANISYNSSFYELEKLSTLTLWATCGRLVGWEGVVCLGNPDRQPQEITTFWSLSVFYASVIFFILVLKSRLSYWLENYWSNKEEESLRHLASRTIRQLKTRMWRKGRRSWRKYTGQETGECDGKDGDLCAVCLDEYSHKQLLRVLPCGHEFHCSCVDRWLLAKRTCPLCKGNIIERLHNTKEARSVLRCSVI